MSDSVIALFSYFTDLLQNCIIFQFPMFYIEAKFLIYEVSIACFCFCRSQKELGKLLFSKRKLDTV